VTAPPSTRLSLNQITTDRWTVAQAVAGCQRAGIGAIGLWRQKVADAGIAAAAAAVQDAGLRVSSLCRGGFFPAPDAAGRAAAIDDNRRAIDEAHALGTDVLVLVCGGLPPGSRDLPGARAMVRDGIAAVAGDAAAAGVRLGIEPLHPMYCADRSVVCTLAQALELAEAFPPEHVGVVLDVYHVWWDPRVDEALSRAEGRIVGFHLNDWVLPLPEGALLGRGLPGDGCIDIDRLAAAVGGTGYVGPVEVEVMNESVWDAPVEETLRRVTAFFERLEAWGSGAPASGVVG
jgi:sugar phosphate isomerase/epimerase